MLEYAASPERLIELVRKFAEESREATRRDATFLRIFRTSPWEEEDIMDRLERLRAALFNEAYISDFRDQVSQFMGDRKVLYLPTYRRIEASSDDLAMTMRRRGRFAVREEESDTDQLIFFGLSDVEEKLERMTRLIQQSMLEAYSRLSGNMLDMLIRGMHSNDC